MGLLRSGRKYSAHSVLCSKKKLKVVARQRTHPKQWQSVEVATDAVMTSEVSTQTPNVLMRPMSASSSTTAPVAAPSGATSSIVYNSRGIVLELTNCRDITCLQSSLHYFSGAIGHEVQRFASLNGIQLNQGIMATTIMNAVLDCCMCDVDKAELILRANLPAAQEQKMDATSFKLLLKKLCQQHGISQRSMADAIMKMEQKGVVVVNADA